MSRLIDADELVTILDEELQKDSSLTKVLLVGFAKQILNDAPTVDAIEVVHCKDCVHWEGTEQGGFYYFERCSLTGLDMIYDDFCSKGERKTE